MAPPARQTKSAEGALTTSAVFRGMDMLLHFPGDEVARNGGSR
jgi:hypothetical protein